MKLTPRLTLIFVLYAAALLAGISLLAFNSGRDSLRSATISELLATAIEKEAALNSWVEDYRAGIALLAADPATIESAVALTAAAPGSLDALAAHDRLVAEIRPRVAGGEFLDLTFIEPQTGKVIAATDPGEEGKFNEDRPFFIQGKTGPYVQNLYFSITLQGPAMTAAAPIRAPDGRLLGVLAGQLNLEEMNAIINRRTGVRQTDDAYLANTSSLFVTQPRFISDPAVLLRGVHTQAVQSCLKRESGVIDQTDYRGVPTIAVFRWLVDRELCLVVKIDQTEAYAPARTFGKTIATFSAMALLIATVLAVALARGLTRPILALQAGAVRFGRGERQVRLSDASHDELGELAREFNRMAGLLTEKEAMLRAYADELERKVEERTQSLQDQNILLNALIDSPKDILIFSLDKSYCYTSFNENHRQEMQAVWQTDIALGMDLLKVMKNSEPRELTRQSLDRVLQGEAFSEIQHQPEPDSYYEFNWSPIRQKDSRVVGIAAFIRNITERKQTEAAIQESEERYRSLFENMLSGYAYCQILLEDGKPNDFTYILVNSQFEKLTGLKNVDGKKVSEAIPGIQGSNPELFEIYGKVAETGIPERFETYIESLGIWFSISVYSPRHGYFVAVFDNITQRKQGEAALARFTEELRRSNTELEQFAYVASHDLQEPLRMITSYLQLIERRYKGRLDTDADEFIAYAVDGAERMKALINDLLAYSRVGRLGKDFQPVDCNAALEQAKMNLQVAIQESGAVITSSPLPTISADEAQIAQLFQNLLSNAIKFRSEKPPEICIDAKNNNGECQFSVKDNGIGIDPQFVDRIFVIFQRLHRKEEYGGTGIGLAICKKIVERHGGRIWVDSQPNEGSNFFFTLKTAIR